jgi:uncharacterized short protein YbdD (DUF466 family)
VNNTDLWDKLGKTDPKHTKSFTRGGGFKGTAIKPMFSYRRMTEEFGPCGIGWGVGEPVFQVVPGSEGEVLVYCTASVWYVQGDKASQTVYGVGGDKVVNKFSTGLKSDDEAFKKAFTDAVTNALKLIGVGADVHMGMFDDSKYVNDMRQEFADEPPPPMPKSSASLKRPDANGDDAWNALLKQLHEDFLDCKSTVTLSKLRADYREKARDAGWPKAWLEALKNEFDTFEEELERASQAIRTNEYAKIAMAG